jgi:hypothetical protein
MMLVFWVKIPYNFTAINFLCSLNIL